MKLIPVTDALDALARAYPKPKLTAIGSERMWQMQLKSALQRRQIKARNSQSMEQFYSDDDFVDLYVYAEDVAAWLKEIQPDNVEAFSTAFDDEAGQDAPVVAAPASELLPLTTGDIAHAFDGLRWSEAQWKKTLGNKPKWLAACIAIPGKQGVSETRWNPVLIAAELVRQDYAKAFQVRSKFQKAHQLKPWLDAWKTYEADNFDTP